MKISDFRTKKISKVFHVLGWLSCLFFCSGVFANPNPLGGLDGLFSILLLMLVMLLMVLLFVGYLLYVLFKPHIDYKIVGRVSKIMMVLSAIAGVICVLFTWKHYPSDIAFIGGIVALILLINALLFVINQVIKKRNPADFMD